VALLSGRYRLSRREARQVLRDLWGVELALGTVVRLEQAQSAALAPVLAELQAALPRERAVGMDESGWRERGKRGWLWTTVASGFTVCRIAASRGAKEVSALLGDEYAGVVGCDRWSAYRRWRRALCHSHLQRAFQGLVDRGGAAAPIGRWGVAEERRLFALWRQFRSGALERPTLRRRLVPLQARFGRLLWRGEACGDRQAAALCRDLNASWEALWRFASAEGVEPTNNAAERALRPAVLWRKGSFGSQSALGSRFAERMLSVAATCRQQGRDLLALLISALEAALSGTVPPSLLPTQAKAP
jgi:transposase